MFELLVTVSVSAVIDGEFFRVNEGMDSE